MVLPVPRPKLRLLLTILPPLLLHQMFNLIHNEMDRKYKYGAVAYMKLLQLQEKVNELESLFLLSGNYLASYAHMTATLTNTIGKLLEQLEFKYK